ncbi:MAG: hypothetical protein GY757_19055 [bacterium]|nr:hypothetical protein [bacterium]
MTGQEQQEQWITSNKFTFVTCKPLNARMHVKHCQQNQEAAMRDEAGRFASGVDPIARSCCKTCSHNRRADKPGGPRFDIYLNRNLKGQNVDWKKTCQLIFDATTTTPESLAKWVGVKVEAVNVWWKYGGRPRQGHRQRIYNRYREKIDFRECVK